MLERAQKTLCRSLAKANLEIYKLVHDEEGDVVEKAIYIGIAVVGALIVMGLLFGEGHDGKGGLINTIFSSIEIKIKEIFGN